MGFKKTSDTVLAYGHENILATHRTTLEFTKERFLTRRGNCVVAVAANKGMNDLDPVFKKELKKNHARLVITIEAGGVKETFCASGDTRLTLSNQTDMVLRKSNHICSRTLGINASKSAFDLSRALVKELKNPEQEVRITLTIEN